MFKTDTLTGWALRPTLLVASLLLSGWAANAQGTPAAITGGAAALPAQAGAVGGGGAAPGSAPVYAGGGVAPGSAPVNAGAPGGWAPADGGGAYGAAVPPVGVGDPGAYAPLPGGPMTTVSMPESKKAAEEQLRDFHETLSRIHRIVGELHKEANRQSEVLYPGSYWMGFGWGDGWDDGLYPYPYYMPENGPPLPMRKKYVDLSMNELIPVMTLFASDMAGLEGPSSDFMHGSDLMKADLLVMADAQKQLQILHSQLQDETRGPQYVNKSISKTCLDMNDELHALNESRKRLLKLLKREG